MQNIKDAALRIKTLKDEERAIQEEIRHMNRVLIERIVDAGHFDALRVDPRFLQALFR